MSLESRSNVPVSVEALVRQIEALDEKTKQELFRQLELAEKTAEVPKKTAFRITDLRGLGKGIYSTPDADESLQVKQIDDYIRTERESWER